MTVNLFSHTFLRKDNSVKSTKYIFKKLVLKLKIPRVLLFLSLFVSIVIHRHFSRNITPMCILLRRRHGTTLSRFSWFRKKIKRTELFYWRKFSDELYTIVCIASVVCCLTYTRDIEISQSRKTFLAHAIVFTPRDNEKHCVIRKIRPTVRFDGSPDYDQNPIDTMDYFNRSSYAFYVIRFVLSLLPLPLAGVLLCSESLNRMISHNVKIFFTKSHNALLNNHRLT